MKYLKVTNQITRAEATMMWFLKGVRHPIVNVTYRIRTAHSVGYDCTKDFQVAIAIASECHVPDGEYYLSNTPEGDQAARMIYESTSKTSFY